MNEELKKLFESSVLNDDTKQVLTSAIEEAVNSKEEELKTQYEAKLVEEKASMLEEVNKIVEEAVGEELGEIAKELEEARSLEVTYAEKLQEFKESYASSQEEQMKVMVSEAVAEELEELQEDIETAKKHEFVMSMFESFKGTYEKLFGTADVNVYDELEEAKKELGAIKHEQKVNELLEGVSGEKREIAKTILEGVSYEKLDKKFDSIKGILLAEATDSNDEPLEESDKGSTDETIEEGSKVVMENVEEEKSEPTIDPKLSEQLKKSLRFAGVNK